MAESRFSAEEVLAALDRVVAEKGDETNEGRNFHFDWEGRPGCVVAHAFTFLGLSVDDMRFADDREPADAWIDSVPTLRKWGNPSLFDEPTWELLQEIQDNADTSPMPWHRAVSVARAKLEVGA